MRTSEAPHSWRVLLTLFVISFGVTSAFQWRQPARAESFVIAPAADSPAPLRVAALVVPENEAQIESSDAIDVLEEAPEERADTQEEDTAIAAIVAAESAD